jgi:hypothetical protein
MKFYIVDIDRLVRYNGHDMSLYRQVKSFARNQCVRVYSDVLIIYYTFITDRITSDTCQMLSSKIIESTNEYFEN